MWETDRQTHDDSIYRASMALRVIIDRQTNKHANAAENHGLLNDSIIMSIAMRSPCWQVAQLLLRNPRNALHQRKRQMFKSVTFTTPLLWVVFYPVARIGIAYLCTKFDDFRFSRSSVMIGAPKICNGSHDLTTPIKDGLLSVGCDLDIQPVHQIWSLCNHQLRRYIMQRKM